jgi:hypothetical protein
MESGYPADACKEYFMKSTSPSPVSTSSYYETYARRVAGGQLAARASSAAAALAASDAGSFAAHLAALGRQEPQLGRSAAYDVVA